MKLAFLASLPEQVGEAFNRVKHALGDSPANEARLLRHFVDGARPPTYQVGVSAQRAVHGVLAGSLNQLVPHVRHAVHALGVPVGLRLDKVVPLAFTDHHAVDGSVLGADKVALCGAVVV